MKSRYFYVILAMYCSHLWNNFSVTTETYPNRSDPCYDVPQYQSHRNNSIQGHCSPSMLTDIGVLVSLACVAITLLILASFPNKNSVIFQSLLLVELSAVAGFNIFGLVVGCRNHFVGSKSIITNTGLIISEVCLIVLIFIFTSCSFEKNHITNSHIHLCLNLFIANMLFLTQSDRVCNKTVCVITAGWLHYFYLTVFAWMFVEGLQLYLMSINLRKMRVSSSAIVQKYKIPFCYLTPAAIVAVCAVTQPSGYGSPPVHCWLQEENQWYFSAVVLLIILVNMILFAKTFWILNEQLSKRNIEVSKIKDTRILTFKILIQVLILGCPWIIGFFNNEILEYVFDILVSLQGFLMFLLLCVFSAEVRQECKNWFIRTAQRHDTAISSVCPTPNNTESGVWREDTA